MFKWLIILYVFLYSTQVLAMMKTDKTKWVEDIRYAQEQIKLKHIHPFHQISESEFDASIDKLILKIDNLNESEIEVELMAILASIKDGHSNYNLMSGPHRHYPFILKFFEDELRVIATTNEYSMFLGSKITAIDTQPIKQIFQTLSPYLSGVDNQFSAKVRFAFQLTINKMLFGTGVTKHKDHATFTFSTDSKTLTKTVNTVEMRTFGSLSSAYPTRFPKLEQTEIGMHGITLSIWEEQNSAYFDFNQYPSVNQVSSNCPSLLKELNERNIQRLIIDFRDNDGGSFFAGLAFSSCLLQLDNINWKKGVTVIVNEGTFSAAMSNAVQFQQILNGTLVGTPTGGDPNQYAESRRLSLPNTYRSFSVSKRYYEFITKPSDALYPDILLKQTWQQYKQGKDQILIDILKSF